MNPDLKKVLLEALEEAIDSRGYQAECAAKSPYGEEEVETANAAVTKFKQAQDALLAIPTSFVVIGHGSDGEPNPCVYEAASAELAADMFKAEWDGQDIHGVYPGSMGSNVYADTPAPRDIARYDEPQVFAVDVMIAGTAYVKAFDAIEARRKVASETEMAVVSLETNEIEVSGARFDDPDLPELSLSPVATVRGLFPGYPTEVE